MINGMDSLFEGAGNKKNYLLNTRSPALVGMCILIDIVFGCSSFSLFDSFVCFSILNKIV